MFGKIMFFSYEYEHSIFLCVINTNFISLLAHRHVTFMPVGFRLSFPSTYDNLCFIFISLLSHLFMFIIFFFIYTFFNLSYVSSISDVTFMFVSLMIL